MCAMTKTRTIRTTRIRAGITVKAKNLVVAVVVLVVITVTVTVTAGDRTTAVAVTDVISVEKPLTDS
jgi:hypothetical protein